MRWLRFNFWLQVFQISLKHPQALYLLINFLLLGTNLLWLLHLQLFLPPWISRRYFSADFLLQWQPLSFFFLLFVILCEMNVCGKSLKGCLRPVLILGFLGFGAENNAVCFLMPCWIKMLVFELFFVRQKCLLSVNFVELLDPVLSCINFFQGPL